MPEEILRRFFIRRQAGRGSPPFPEDRNGKKRLTGHQMVSYNQFDTKRCPITGSGNLRKEEEEIE